MGFIKKNKNEVFISFYIHHESGCWEIIGANDNERAAWQVIDIFKIGGHPPDFEIDKFTIKEGEDIDTVIDKINSFLGSYRATKIIYELAIKLEDRVR